MRKESWSEMRVTRPTLAIFLKEIDELEKEAVKLREIAKRWEKQQEYRDNGWGVDQYGLQFIRNNLEKHVIAYRRQLAKIYDFTGDSGLR